jgi:hypothetical protein
MTLQIQPMTAQRLLRLAVVGLLKQKLNGFLVESPGVWPVPQDKLPAVLVRAPNGDKQSINKGLPEFNTTVTVEVLGQVKGDRPDLAQDAVEDLAFQVEQLILQGYWINRVVQQFASVSCDIEVRTDGQVPLAGFKMQIQCETFEAFDATVVIPDGTTWPMPEPDTYTTDLQGVNLHVDAVQPADPNGAYSNPLFPSSVTPAPRTGGPDGRDEGYLQIDLPQA